MDNISIVIKAKILSYMSDNTNIIEEHFSRAKKEGSDPVASFNGMLKDYFWCILMLSMYYFSMNNPEAQERFGKLISLPSLCGYDVQLNESLTPGGIYVLCYFMLTGKPAPKDAYAEVSDEGSQLFLSIVKNICDRETPPPAPVPESAVLKEKTTSPDKKKEKIKSTLATLVILMLICIAVFAIKEGIKEVSSQPQEQQIIDTVEPTTLMKETETQRPTLEAKPRPMNSEILINMVDGECLAPLEIVAPDSDDYLIKLKRTDSSRYLLFYVRGGTPASIDVPLGTYIISYACGSTWYGVNDLFGEDTDCYKMDSSFLFSEEGGYYTGYTLELYLQPNGNLDKERIDPEDF